MKTLHLVYFPTFTTAMLVAGITTTATTTFTTPLSIMDFIGAGFGFLVIAGGKANIVMCQESGATTTLTDSMGGTHTSAPLTTAIAASIAVQLS